MYMLYEIQPTGPSCRLATQQVGYDQTKKIYHGCANCSQTHNIISLLAPDEFNVIIRTGHRMIIDYQLVFDCTEFLPRSSRTTILDTPKFPISSKFQQNPSVFKYSVSSVCLDQVRSLCSAVTASRVSSSSSDTSPSTSSTSASCPRSSERLRSPTTYRPSRPT